MVGTQHDIVGGGVLVDTDELRRVAGRLERLRDDGGDDLAAVGDRRRLEHRQLAFGAGEAGRVLRREHAQHAGQGERGLGVDPAHHAPRDRGGDDRGVGDALGRMLEGVDGLAGDLLTPLDPLDGGADRPDGDAHAASSSSVCTSAARARPTL